MKRASGIIWVIALAFASGTGALAFTSDLGWLAVIAPPASLLGGFYAGYLQGLSR